jgi:hypothetical protein
MTSDDKPNLAHPLQDADPAEEVVPDYSRLGFRDLQQLVKARGMTADGRHAELIEKLKAWDAERGREPDLTIPVDDGDEVDLLADDDTPSGSSDTTAHTPEPADSPDHAQAAPETQPTPETPSGGGEAASASPPDGTVTFTTPPPGNTGTLTAASPATVVVTAPGEPEGLPPALVRGRPNTSVRTGVVRVGEGHGAAEVRAYRQEWPLGPRDITDTDHARFIADTHAAAHAAGHETKGGVTIGERLFYAADTHGQRTVIYQVPLRRKR